MPLTEVPRALLGSDVEATLDKVDVRYVQGSVQVLSGAGTYTPTAGVRAIRVQMVGGGGPGAGCGNTNAGEATCGNGGAAGGYVDHFITSPLASYAYSVGAAGVGVSGTGGSPGGNTTFGSLSANGGSPGTASLSAGSFRFQGTPAAGGAANGGNIANILGQSGKLGATSAVQAFGGEGGSSPLGAGGAAINNVTGGTSVPGSNATGFGAGGGGAGVLNRTSGAAIAGGNGSPGIIIVTEYF